MLRTMTKTDLDPVLQLWLTANLEAHSFIPAVYWYRNEPTVKADLLQAQVTVYAEQEKVLGFIGLQGDFIAGLFVAKGARNHGIGSQLLRQAKTDHNTLALTVYQKNQQAWHFYQQQGFQLVKTQLDANTQEEEYLLRWQAKA